MRSGLHPWSGHVLVGNHVHRHFDIHRSLQRIAVQFAITLSGVSIAEVQQSSGNIHGQVHRRAFDDFIEVHVSAVTAGIAGARSGLRDSRSNRYATQHWAQWNRIVRQMLRWFFWRSDPIRQVEMPANILEAILHFYGPIAVQSASDDPVV